MAEQASRSARQKGKGKSEEGYGPGAGKDKARAPSQGRNKGKAQTKGGGKEKGHAQGQGSGKGSPPAPSAVQLDPLLEAAYQLYLQGHSHNQSRVSRNAWLRNNLRNNSEVRTQLRQRMEAAQGALRSERSGKTPPANPASPECSPPGHQPDGSANAEVVATTPQTAQPSSPQAGLGPQASSAAAAQDSVQEATPPRVLSPKPGGAS